MATFISNAIGKIPNKEELVEARNSVAPRRQGKYVPIVTGNRSDFEIIQLPKVKFIKDHNGQLISKRGKIIGQYQTLMPLVLKSESKTVGRPNVDLINQQFV